MDYKKELVNRIEKFYVEIIEEFKEIEMQIAADSRFKSVFKKKDYEGNIVKLKLCKKACVEIETDDIEIPKTDKLALDVMKNFERSLLIFNFLCDSYVQLQAALNRKANKEALKFSEYKELFNKVQATRVNLNNALHELDIDYTEYTYDENEDPYTFLN
ncbi:MAG: hypothetical protein GX663_09470 [Clostridiales bacterium]|nr:hypothetical protein [Clostridiales bacterium]